MAGRVLNRRELRRQSDAAESADREDVADETDAAEEDPDEEEVAEHADEEGDDKPAPVKAKAKAKAKAAPKARKPRKPKAAPRMRARWGVFDASMKQVAVFDYKDRAAADAKVIALLAAKKTGTFFLQIVKEPMTEDTAPTPGPAGADLPGG